MQLSNREKVILELALIDRKHFLESVNYMPGKEEKLIDVNALLKRFR